MPRKQSLLEMAQAPKERPNIRFGKGTGEYAGRDIPLAVERDGEWHDIVPDSFSPSGWAEWLPPHKQKMGEPVNPPITFEHMWEGTDGDGNEIVPLDDVIEDPQKHAPMLEARRKFRNLLGIG